MTVTITKPKFNLRDTLNSLKKKTGLFGEQIMRAETATDLYNVIGQNRNILINGSMDVWQRGTAWTSGNDNDLYTADRWHFQRYAANSASISRQSATDNAFNYCIRVGRVTGDANTTGYYINQPVEGLNSKRCLGKWVTFSYWIRTGSAHQPSDYFASSIVYHTDAAYQNDGMYYNNFRSAAPSSVASDLNLLGKVGTVWKRFEQTTYIPAGAVQVGVSVQSAGNGTATSNDYFEVTGVQLEIGNVATPFEHRSFGAELALCQRYYFPITLPQDTNIAYPAVVYGNTTLLMQAFPVTISMRATPTVTTFIGTAYPQAYRYDGASNVSQALTSLNASGRNTNGVYWFEIQYTGASSWGAATSHVNLGWTSGTNSKIFLSAEL